MSLREIKKDDPEKPPETVASIIFKKIAKAKKFLPEAGNPEDDNPNLPKNSQTP